MRQFEPQPLPTAPMPMRTNIQRLSLDVDEWHCAQCGKRVRKSAQSRVEAGTKRLFRWCNKCWFKKGARFGRA